MSTPLKLAPIILCALSSACISHQETVYEDVPRVKVAFENEKAAATFYEALSRPVSRRQHNESKTEVHIPVVFDHKRTVLSGPNAEFNEAVNRCDTNKDGTVSETEAKIFAELREK